mgnify:CR=1 FL=1
MQRVDYMTEAQNKENLLTIRGLKISARVDNKWCEIVHGIDLDLKRGEVLGLIGESGAGKSSVGLAAMGFTRNGCEITGGSVDFDGIDMARASDSQKQALRGMRIAYVAQSAAASFNPAHKLINQYVEAPTTHGTSNDKDAREEAISLYRKLQLPAPESIGFRYPHQLSGGQLQRAMTAMAMSCKPDLIIFDEPTTALDVTTQIEVLAAIREIVREYNTAALYISHDLAVVAQMADRMQVLKNGNTVEIADTATMLAAPVEDYTKTLWAVRNIQRPEADTANADVIMELNNIDASYVKGGEKILKDISIKVKRGQTLAVVGESGSGKSTTARVISGLLEASRGDIVFNGKALPTHFKQRDKNTLRQIQMIYQMPDTALNPRQKVADIIGRPLQFYLGLNRSEKRARTEQLLEQVELDPGQYLNRYPGELSGGQKQRICIARALAAEPEFIICDEVTSALDQAVNKSILDLLTRLQKELNLTYLFITHDLATVQAIADEVVVMLKGEVVEQDTRKALFAPPHHEYTERLLSSVPQMDPDWLNNLLDQRRGQVS